MDGGAPKPIRIDRPTLLRIQGPAELAFTQAPGGGFAISGSPPKAGGPAKAGAIFQIKGDANRIQADVLSFSSTDPSRESERAPPVQAAPAGRSAEVGEGVAGGPTAEWTLPRFALRGELVIGSPPREPNWEDEAQIAVKPGGLLSATVIGREGGWPSDHRFEVLREDLELGDQLFTGDDSTDALKCKIEADDPEGGHAWATISVAPDPDTADGTPHRFHVIAHARRQSFFVRRGGGAEFGIGASVLEVLTKHSIAQTLWAIVIVIALLLTLITDLMALARSGPPKPAPRPKANNSQTRRKK